MVINTHSDSESNDLGLSSPLVPSLNFSTAYHFSSAENLKQYHANKFINNRYSRDSNEIGRTIEKIVESHHQGLKALSFNSGMAAIISLLDSIWTNNDRIVLQDEIYRKTSAVFKRHLETSNSKIYFLNSTTGQIRNFENLKSGMPKKIICFLEMPSNPHLKLIDVAKLRQQLGKSAVIIVDASLTSLGGFTPKGLELVDGLIFSATKYIGGHNDVFGGFALVKPELYMELWESRSRNGTILNPKDAYEIFRSLKTHEIRLSNHTTNYELVLNRLDSLLQEGLIKKIYFPGLYENSHQMSLVADYLTFCGSMISFVPKKKLEELEISFAHLNCFKMAPSFGSVDTLFEIPKTMSYDNLSKDEFSELGIEENLVRLSVGIEPIEKILKDLDKLIL